MPFSDPMADGPAIQASSLRALKAGMTVKATLALVGASAKDDDKTPIVLMGYYNPIHAYGVREFRARRGARGYRWFDHRRSWAGRRYDPARSRFKGRTRHRASCDTNDRR